MYNIPSSPDDHHPKIQKKKRVGKACDSCRIKKTKCDGKKPCNKCIQDNKICVFTEKKKIKEKNYPSGYVELLETRLDLLTKSFEKMIQLSRPHLRFLNDLVIETNEDNDDHNNTGNGNGNSNDGGNDDDDDIIPINKVINYLINNEGLLKNLPIEWEGGAIIAANYTDNDMDLALKKFANHKLSLDSNDLSNTNSIDEYQQLQSQSHLQSQSIQSKSQPNPNDLNLDDDYLLDENINLNQFQLSGYSTGGFVLANSAALNDGISNDLSDFESDLNSIYSVNVNSPGLSPGLSSQNLTLQNSNSQNISNTGGNNIGNNVNINNISGNNGNNPGLHGSGNFDIRPASLFDNRDVFNQNNSSNTLLHDKFSPSTISPASTFDSQLHNQHNHNHQHNNSNSNSNSISGSVSNHRKQLQRPRSPSFQKLKNSGHIHKPIKSEFEIRNSLLDNDITPSQINDLKYEYDDNILKDL